MFESSSIYISDKIVFQFCPFRSFFLLALRACFLAWILFIINIGQYLSMAVKQQEPILLGFGSTGTQVTELQKQLNTYLSKINSGFVKITEDGVFGQQTYDALLLAQSKLGVRADGLFYTATSQALSKALAAPSKQAALKPSTPGFMVSSPSPSKSVNLISRMEIDVTRTVSKLIVPTDLPLQQTAIPKKKTGSQEQIAVSKTQTDASSNKIAVLPKKIEIFVKKTEIPSKVLQEIFADSNAAAEKGEGVLTQKYGAYSYPRNDCAAYIINKFRQHVKLAPNKNWPAFPGFTQTGSVGSPSSNSGQLKANLKAGDLIYITGNDVYPVPLSDPDKGVSQISKKYAPKFKGLQTHVGIYGGDGYVYDWPGARKVSLDEFVKKSSSAFTFRLA